ncbi:hypothetical protein PBI_SHEAKEIRA_41 [Mycobacterium phage SheaKeira]|nr:hypothetical protein PBI_SHEAKEIRA_41 [Mycobacterium phage SheaKeira]
MTEKYTVLLPVPPEALEEPHNVETLEAVAQLHLAGIGYVVEGTFEMTVHERARIDGNVLPWRWGGFELPDDTVLLRYTALVEPYATEEV